MTLAPFVPYIPDLLLAFVAWTGGVTVAICIVESERKRVRGVLMSGAASLILAFGTLFLIFG